MKVNEEMVTVSGLGGAMFAKSWIPADCRYEPLILFHDSLGCTDTWKGLPTELASLLRRQVISYDRLGFGRSDRRESLPSSRFVEEEADVYLPSILDYFEVDQFSVLGHSVGGGMSVHVAAQFPSRCKRLVTVSAQAFVEQRTRDGILAAKAFFAGPDAFNRLRKYHGDKTEWVLKAWIDVWLSEAFSNWTLEDVLPKVMCPTLVIHGGRDEYGSLAFPEMIAERVGGVATKKVFEACGHMPHKEAPEKFKGALDSFFGLKL